MFVECYSGLMGGGKTFCAAERMLEHIARGGVVFSNIQLLPDPWFNDSYADCMREFHLSERYERCRKELTRSGIADVRVGDNWVYNSRGFKHALRVKYGWNYQPGQFNLLPDDAVGPRLYEMLPRGELHKPVLVVIDEALDWFESGCGAAGMTEFRSFLRHVRKLGINLIFIAQDWQALEKKIRTLTHFVWCQKDLHTWPVPVLGRPLPKPWGDHILSHQYHAGQFGKAKADSINKRTWIYRDHVIYGCYQSVGLHNASLKLADDMQVDFEDSGKIRKGKNIVKPIERIIIYTALLVLVALNVSAFRNGNGEVVQEESIQAVLEDSPPDLAPEKPIVVYGDLSWVERGGLRRYSSGLYPVEPGRLHPDYGVCVRVSPDSATFVDSGVEYELRRGRPPLPVDPD